MDVTSIRHGEGGPRFYGTAAIVPVARPGARSAGVCRTLMRGPGWGLHLPGPPRRRSGQQMFSKAPLPSGLADEMLLATIAFLIGSE